MIKPHPFVCVTMFHTDTNEWDFNHLHHILFLPPLIMDASPFLPCNGLLNFDIFKSLVYSKIKGS